MIYTQYKETALEQWIYGHYLPNNICVPEDLEIDSIAYLFKVDVAYYNRSSFSDNNDRVIFLDKRLRDVEQRTIFFHELCHVLRHVGDQRNLPDLFMEAQETEADQFALYAAIPFFMLSDLHLPDHREEAVKYIANTFLVTPKFADKRLHQIERRLLQGQFDAAVAEYTFNREVTSIHETNVEGAALYAFHDSEGAAGVSQIVIETDFSIEADFFFPIDGSFERLEIDDFYGYKCMPLAIDDFIYKDGQVGVNFSILSLKYGRGAKRFVIQMSDIEQLIAF